MKYVTQIVYLRQDKWTQPWRENSFLVPLPCRRTASAFSEFNPANAHPRSRSARHAPLTAPPAPGYGMQRQQFHSNIATTTTITTSSSSSNNSSLSVARLYDWSPELAQERDESVSISRLYREIAGGVGASLPRFLTDKARARVGVGTVCNASVGTSQLVAAAAGGSVGARLNPGRMFLRDKGMLTKGEREIIEGIYKNRGDLQKEAADSQSRAEFFVRSHHDAWLIGKPGLATNKPSTEVPRDPLPRGGLLEVMSPTTTTTTTTASPDLASHNAEDVLHQRQGNAARPHCIMCWKEQQFLLQLQQQQQQQQKQQSRQESSPRKDEGHQRRRGRHPFFKERGHKLHPHQQKQNQQLLLPFNGVLKPVNLNVSVVQAYRHHGEIEEAPAAPPTSPISKLPPALAAAAGLAGANNSNSGSPSTFSTKNGLRGQPRNRLEHMHVLGVPDPQQVHLGEDLHFFSDSDDSFDLGPEGLAVVKGKADGGGKAKKVQVKVVLPQVASDPSEEAEAKSHGHNQPTDPLSTIVMQGRPALARSERHLSPSDLKDDNPMQGSKGGGASEGPNKSPSPALPTRLTPDNVLFRKSPSTTPSSSARTTTTKLLDDRSNNSHSLSERRDNNNNSSSTNQHLQLKVHHGRPVLAEKENEEKAARPKTESAEASDSCRTDRRLGDDRGEEEGASKENVWDPSGHGCRQFTTIRVPLRAHPVVITLVEGGDVKDS